MKSKNPTGYMIMFLETDLKYAKKFKTYFITLE